MFLSLELSTQEHTISCKELSDYWTRHYLRCDGFFALAYNTYNIHTLLWNCRHDNHYLEWVCIEGYIHASMIQQWTLPTSSDMSEIHVFIDAMRYALQQEYTVEVFSQESSQRSVLYKRLGEIIQEQESLTTELEEDDEMYGITEPVIQTAEEEEDDDNYN